MMFLILPNQLFESKYLNKSYRYILWECPHFFTAYNYNKKKLLLHRASMKYYFDYLTKKGFNVLYVEFHKKLNQNINYTLYNPLNKIELLNITNYTIYDKPSPNLLINDELLKEYNNKTKKFFFNAFYMYMKKKLDNIEGINIIKSLKSQDENNRKKLPSDQKLPTLNTKNKYIKYNKYINEAINYINKHFKNNYGNTDNFIFVITHKDAKKWLKDFIKYKSKLFGDYQDFIHQTEPYLYHSLLSSMINIGLINPSDIIGELYSTKIKIPLNSYEGFIRQLFWREYQYYCYIYRFNDINNNFNKFNDINNNFNNLNNLKTYFANNNKLTNAWYSGTLGIKPVDDAIKDGFETGYLHHIRRLMVVGNYMNLCRISPKEGFRWFMEFSCDSYEWVMHQNVYDMVFFISGAITMKRPYISSSNYILKMSNYKRDEWCDIWDDKYRTFIEKNRDKLYKFRYYIKLY